ncbi:MAG: homocitrate synthase [Spirulinaceae cyanobacterium]
MNKAMPLTNFAIIETTLREGEQFVGANFSLRDKIEIAIALDRFGVEYIELTSPYASPQSRQSCQYITKLGLKAKVLTHIRCHLEDAKVALDTEVDGVNLFVGTSYLLRQFSHGKTIQDIIGIATEVINFIHKQSPQTEIRFSTEDSFRSSINDLLKVYLTLDKLGIVKRFGIADTVGVATPAQVCQLVKTLRHYSSTDIEFHGHNDTGCAVANSYAALEAGATHIDTTVLGIGERNGITPLAGLIACLYAFDPQRLRRKYNLAQIPVLHEFVADKVGVEIPFNHCIVGKTAFSHKAGVHTKAILNNPSTYEILDPRDFSLQRSLLINHPLTGKHAVAQRAAQLGLKLNQAQIKALTNKIKSLTDLNHLTTEEVDKLLVASSH